MSRLRPLLTPPMAVALLALLVALGGTSYAAATLARNSVGTLQIRDGAVTSVDVKNRSLRAGDFAKGQLPAGPRGPAGAAGPTGATGPAGPTGSTGQTGSSAFAFVTGVATLPTANTTTSLDGRVQAPSGSSVATLSPDVATSLRNFSVKLDSVQPAGTGRSFQLRINESPSLLCSVDAGASACTSSAVVAIPAGATVRLVVLALVNGGTQITNVARWGATIGTS